MIDPDTAQALRNFARQAAHEDVTVVRNALNDYSKTDLARAVRQDVMAAKLADLLMEEISLRDSR